MRFLRILIVWSLCVALYLSFAGSVDWSEGTVGAAAGLVAALFVHRLRRHFDRPLKTKPAWFLFLLRIPSAMLQETTLILVVLLRRFVGRGRPGKVIDYPYPGEKDDEYDPARRAFMAFGVCITPNSYLVDYDRRRRRVLIRQLAGDELSRVDRVFVELP